MTVHAPIDHDVDYNTYRFGRSRQRFRGPKPDLSEPYISFVGGSETFGKFVEQPFPARLQDALDYTCANWGSGGLLEFQSLRGVGHGGGGHVKPALFRIQAAQQPDQGDISGAQGHVSRS